MRYIATAVAFGFSLALVSCAERRAGPASYSFIQSFGSSGSGPGQFRRPAGIAIGARGELYVADSGNQRIQIFSAGGGFLRSWGTRGTGDGQFETPVDVALGRDGSVFVSDFELDRVQQFTHDGRLIRKWGKTGSGPGEFDGAAGLDVSRDGQVWVADFSNHRVQFFDADGRFLVALGRKGHGLGEFNYPTDVTVRPDGTILVADAYNHRLQALTSNGEVVPNEYDIGKSLAPPLMVPTGVALDRLGRMHIADSGRKRAVLLSASGVFEAQWKLSPDSHPETYSPTRVAVRGKRVYYVDTSNDRVVGLEVSR
jgi:DNA-binding beta-propeller fold protein YncE